MKLLLTTALLLFWGSAIAQLNESDTVKYQLRTSLAGNYQQGNVNLLLVRTKIDFSTEISKGFVFKTQNSSLYQAFSEKKADNDIFSRNYLYYKPQNKIYPFAIGYISANYRRKIDRRVFAGIGATCQLINTRRNVLKLSANAVYESTQFNTQTYNFDQYNGADKIHLWRGTVYTAGWNYLFHKKMRLYYNAYYQPAFNDRDNYRTQFDIGVDFPIWKGLAFNALYTFTHENVVPLKIKQEDKILTFGLSYNFKKI